MCRTQMYQQGEEEESNRSMQEELMIGPDFDFNDSDEEEFLAYWASLNHRYDADNNASNMEDGLSAEDFDWQTLFDGEGGDDCAEIAQCPQRFNIGEDIQTVEEVEDWATRAIRTFEASQQTK